jgi:hypothetical protein
VETYKCIDVVCMNGALDSYYQEYEEFFVLSCNRISSINGL